MTELEIIEKEAKKLQKQFDKKGDIDSDVLFAKVRSVANGIEAIETKKQQAAKKKLKWQDTLTKFVIGVYRRTHKDLLDSMKEAVRARRVTIETFIASDIDAFEEFEIDDLWLNAIPEWLQDYKTVNLNNHNIRFAVKAKDNGRIFEVFVMSHDEGRYADFKFLTIKVGEDYIYIDRDESCPNITFSAETIYKLVDMAVNQVGIILNYDLPLQMDLAFKVSVYNINKIRRQFDYNQEQAEKDYQESLAKLKEQLGNFDD